MRGEAVVGTSLLYRQPLVGAVTATLAVVALSLAWLIQPNPHLGRTEWTLVALLAAAIAVSKLFPIRIGKVTRLYIASIPIYLLCSLFSPPVAALGIAAGMLVRELTTCRECENSAGSVGSQLGRWVLVALAVSGLNALVPTEYTGYGAAAVVLLLWLGDVFTCPLLLAPVTGKSPAQIIARVSKQSCVGELMQYLIAMMVLLLTQSGILWTGIIWLDLASAQLIILPIVLLYMYLKNEDLNGATQ